jgi:NRPS condensation-like uncharacterized protein
MTINKELVDKQLTNRQLGYMEARMHYMQACLNGTTQGCLALKVNGCFNQEQFSLAVESVVARIPHARCIIAERGNTPFFLEETTPTLPLNFESGVRATQWLQIFNRENNSALDHSSALWRLTVCPVEDMADLTYIYMSLHHSIADGTSADIFIDEIFKAYASIDGEIAQTDFEFLPPAENLLPAGLTQSWEDFNSVFNQVAASPVQKKDEFVCSVDLAQRATKTLELTIAPEKLADIESYCKDINLPLNSFLSTALLRAYHVVKYDMTGALHPVSFHTTFSLRRLCGLGKNSFGCYMSVVPMTFTHEQLSCSSYELIKVHHKKISQSILKLSRQPVSFNSQAIKAQVAGIANSRNFACDIGFTFGESNVRRQYNQLSIEHIYPTVNRSAGNIALVIHCLKYNSSINISINYTSPNQTDEFVNSVLAKFTENLSIHNASEWISESSVFA